MLAYLCRLELSNKPCMSYSAGPWEACAVLNYQVTAQEAQPNQIQSV